VDGNQLLVIGPSGQVLLPDSQEMPSAVPKTGQAARTENDKTYRPQNQNHARNQLPAAAIGDPSPIPRRRTPTAPHTADNFPFVFNSHLVNPPPPPRKQSPIAALRTCAASGPPISQSHAGPPSRVAPHACATGPVRRGRKPSPAVPVPRHRRKRGPLRCVDQVPRAG
jgi:hypothetical protein